LEVEENVPMRADTGLGTWETELFTNIRSILFCSTFKHNLPKTTIKAQLQFTFRHNLTQLYYTTNRYAEEIL
jgi:hypothetical protein